MAFLSGDYMFWLGCIIMHSIFYMFVLLSRSYIGLILGIFLLIKNILLLVILWVFFFFYNVSLMQGEL